MKKFIDLHTHSNASDGSMSPAEVVIAAKDAGLSAIALTDHDTFEGIEEALAQSKKSGIELMPGVEISVAYKTEMHILGYFKESTYKNFNSVLENLKKNRNKRNPKIINKLNEIGFSLTMEDVKNETRGSIIGRPHIAKTILKKGYVKSMDEAFKKYLSEGRPAYFKRDELGVKEGIEEICKAGGMPVLAHPIFLYLNNEELDVLLKNMKAYGLKGIEAYYSENSETDTGNLLRLAVKNNLIVTGGSDFHGTYKPNINIGTGRGNLKIPYEILNAFDR
ncbi:MAG: PHP domain-containing protein [Clostridia bacterium]|jgi:hypothetical protein